MNPAEFPESLPRVVVVGNIGIDTSVYLPGREIDLTLEGHFTEDLDCVGQAGGYTCRGYARLGICANLTTL